ncbi:MAG: hypothetical protein WCG27_09340 [Pseudomonadota bacterium]
MNEPVLKNIQVNSASGISYLKKSPGLFATTIFCTEIWVPSWSATRAGNSGGAYD